MADVSMNFWGDVSIEKMFDIHDNQKVVICSNGERAEEKPAGGSPGPHKKGLFADKAAADREKERFLSYLNDHKMGNRVLSCSKDDTLNDIVTCFVIQWIKLGYAQPEPSGYSIFRFLTEECGLANGVTDKSFANKIGERIRKRIYTIQTWRNIGEYFQA